MRGPGDRRAQAAGRDRLGGVQPRRPPHTGRDAVEWATLGEQAGAGEILLTSMDRDGTHAGYDIELTRAVSGAVRLPVIASGGAGSARHMYDALTEGGADAALAASIFHFGEISIPDVKQELAEMGLEVRR